MQEQHDPDLDTTIDLQRAITATLTYLMGRSSLAQLFGLQGYLSTMASNVAQEMPAELRKQLAEMECNNQRLEAMQAQQHKTSAKDEDDTPTPRSWR